MKKLLLLLCGCLAAFGAGSVSQSVAPITNSNGFVVTMTWTGDNITGSVPATIILNAQQLQGQRIVAFETAPLSPAPTPGYSVTLTDFSGTDLLTGNGANLSATTPALLTLPSAQPPLYGSYTLNVTGNSVASAQGRVVIYFAPVSGIVGVLGPLGTITTAGTTPSGAANTTNPVKIAGAFNTTQPTVTNGQVVDAQSTARGAQIVATGIDTFNTTVNTALPAGGNTIGAVNQGTNPWTIQGATSSGASNGGNPTKIGGVFNTTQPTVTTGQTVDAQTTARGAQIVATGVDTLNATINTALPTGANTIGGVNLSTGVPDLTGSGTLNALNTTASIPLNGMTSASILFNAGNNLVGSIVAEYSNDGGATWTGPTYFRNFGFHVWYTPDSFFGGPLHIMVPGGASNLRVRVSAFTSGSATATLRATAQPEAMPITASGIAAGDNGGGNPVATVVGTADQNVVGTANTVRSLNSDITASGALGALNANVAISMNGLSSFLYAVPGGSNFVGTFQCQYSSDGGTTWWNTYQRGEAAANYVWFGLTNGNAVSSPAAFTGSCLVPGGASNMRVIANPYTSGTVTITVRAAYQPEMQPFFVSQDGSTRSGGVAQVSGQDNGETFSGSAFPANHQIATDIKGHTNIPNVLRTYAAAGGTGAQAANTTDLSVLPGNATNTVLLTRFVATCQQTTAGNFEMGLRKLTTADTGGTSSSMSVALFDSTNASANSVPLTYTANPTGAGVGNFFDFEKVFVPSSTTGVGRFEWVANPAAEPVILRGTAQGVAFSFNGVTMTGGACDVRWEWVETFGY